MSKTECLPEGGTFNGMRMYVRMGGGRRMGSGGHGKRRRE